MTSYLMDRRNNDLQPGVWPPPIIPAISCLFVAIWFSAYAATRYIA